MRLLFPLLSTLILASASYTESPTEEPTPITRSTPKPPPVTKPATTRVPATSPPHFSRNSTNEPVIPTYDRPRIVLLQNYWSELNCIATKCRETHERCVQQFDGDGCSCYPGLLQCTRLNCLNEYRGVLGECYSHQPKDTRCALECAPSYYPFISTVDDQDTIIAPKSNTSNEIINIPVSVDWSVVATFSILQISTKDFDNAAYEFIDTLLSFLYKNGTSLTSENISYVVLDRTTSPSNLAIEVNLIVECGSQKTMYHTDILLESLLFSNETSTPFTRKLVGVGILFNATQFDVQSVKTQVRVASLTGPSHNSSSSDNVPRGPPSTTQSSSSSVFGLPPGIFMAIIAGGAAFLALLIACLCLKCRKKRAAQRPPSPLSVTKNCWQMLQQIQEGSLSSRSLGPLIRQHTERIVQRAKISRRLVLSFVLLQVIWALAMPIKNVIIIKYPSFRDDSLFTTTEPSEPYNITRKRSYTGHEVQKLIQDVLVIALDNAQVRALFEQANDFAIDQLGQILSPQDHAIMTEFYTIMFQVSEFPGGVFTARKETVISYRPDGTNFTYEFGCRADQVVLGGTTCIDSKNLPCDDSAWDAPASTRVLTDVSFDSFLNGTGWQSNIGLIGMVEYFYFYMRLVFRKKNWIDVVRAENIDMGFGTIDNDSNRYLIESPLYFQLIARSNRELTLNSSVLWNCIASEALLGEVYMSNYTLGYIQHALVTRGLYNATEIVETPKAIAERALVVLNGTIHITSSAGFAGFRDSIKKLGQSTMTRTALSSVIQKRDRPMTGSMLIGSSIRNIVYMSYYPNSYYSALKTYPEGKDYILRTTVLGGMFGNFNGFKFDFVHNTMRVMKLAERSKELGTGYASDWYTDEATIASWFARYEGNRGSNNIIDDAAARLGALTPATETSCYQALVKRLAQAAWLLTLKWHPSAEHLAFMSVNAESDPDVFFFKQMLKNEIVGENTYGYRIHLPFNPTNVSTARGTSWPMVPLLRGLIQRHGFTEVLSQWTTLVNASFVNLVEFENGRFQFYDISACPIGASTFGVASSDTMTTAYAKIFPGVSLLLSDILTSVDSLFSMMEVELQQSIQVRKEYLNDTRVNSIFKYQGPPVYWTHTALAVGLVKLSSQSSPDDAVVDQLRQSLVCYDVFEARYLNRTTRCWNEFQNVNETRWQYNSEGLRTLLLSAWSMSIVLNIIAFVVAVRFAIRIFRVARVTNLVDDPRTLLCIDIEEYGITTFSEGALMAFSALPFMISYQLPQDSEYIGIINQSHLGSVYLDECMVTMALTWYIRLGMDIGSTFVNLKTKNGWFAQISTTVRAAIIVALFIGRLSSYTASSSYNNAILTTLLFCFIATFAGCAAMMLSVLFDRPLAPMNVDRISNILQLKHIPRNIHFIFGQLGRSWSHVGLLLDGWTCASDKSSLILTNRDGRLLLIVRDDKIEVNYLNQMNQEQFNALERTPSCIRASQQSQIIRSTKTFLNRLQVVPFNADLDVKQVSYRWKKVLACCIVGTQALWALSLPMRNVFLFPNPTFNYDTSLTTTRQYPGYDKYTKLEFTGHEVLQIIQDALKISTRNPNVRKIFEAHGDFSIDALGQVLAPSDHETFARLYALVFQSSEFPAGKYTPRQETISRVLADGTSHSYIVGCRAEDAQLGGTTCADINGKPCKDANTYPSTMTDVDISSLYNSSGWHNNIALLSFVDYFHHYMRLVFKKQVWREVVASGNRGLGQTRLTSDGNLIETPSIFALAVNGSRQIAESSSIVWNCLATELLLTEMYIANYTLQMIQEALMSASLYNAVELVRKDPIVTERALLAVKNATVAITSAAGYYNYSSTVRSIFSFPLTASAISTSALKRNLNLASTSSLGSSVEMLLSMSTDGASQFSLQRVTPSSNQEYIIETRLLGGLYGGYVGFKNDPISNTKGVYKIAERSPRTSSADLKYFDEEEELAAWYAAYEDQKDTNNTIHHVVDRFGTIRVKIFRNVLVNTTTDSFETICYQALMRRITQIVWLTALRLHPNLQYLVFMSAQNDVTDRQWFHLQMQVNQIVGEDAYGGRVRLPYNPLFVSTKLGTGWPIVPLLHALKKRYNQSYLQNQIIQDMNASFTSLIELEMGLVNFRDITHCPLGTNYFGVTVEDSLDSMYRKVFPGLDGVVYDVIHIIDQVHAEMETTLQRQVRIPQEYFEDDTRNHPTFLFHGPPIQWSHLPLGIGLIKLCTKEAPFPDSARPLRDSMVCYDTLETRTLTGSICCWSETLSTAEVRSAFSSIRLRLVVFSAWSIGIVLNGISSFIVLRYIVKIWRAYRLTGFNLSRSEIGLLLSTRLESIGVVSPYESGLLACSSIALLFGYRLPHDSMFVQSTTSLRMPYLDECIMTLGLTWSIHFGMELASLKLCLAHPNRWFRAQNALAKVIIALMVYILLVLTRDSANYDKAIGSLIGIWIFSFSCGFFSMALSACMDKRVSPTENNEFADSLMGIGLPLNQYGHLSLQQGRWSLLGIVLEGWHGMATSSCSYLMTCRGVLLYLSGGGTIEPLKCRAITVSDFKRLVQTTANMRIESVFHKRLQQKSKN